jgi:hypothetical protein
MAKVTLLYVLIFTAVRTLANVLRICNALKLFVNAFLLYSVIPVYLNPDRCLKDVSYVSQTRGALYKSSDI